MSTHYVRHIGDAVDRETFSKIVEDVKYLIERSPAKIRGSYGTGKPSLNTQRIAFNGDEKAGESMESFILKRVPDGWGMSFTKTDSIQRGGDAQPYDLIVKAALIVAAHHAPQTYKVSSDDRLAEWWEARAYCNQVLHRAHQIPEGVL